ncbi:MAG: hypothetical protein AAF502_04415 [Bacteroidota bacterium]
MTKCALLHFRALEKYPPTLNLISFLENHQYKAHWKVFTTAPRENMTLYVSSSDKISFHRTNEIYRNQPAISRALIYFRFYIGTLIRLILWRPEVVLYFESISAYPAIIYKRFFNRKARLFVHYHEYIAPHEYREGMKLNNYFHQLEKKIYPDTEWVSHTHPTRLKDFLNDNKEISFPSTRVMPNFPPRNWLLKKEQYQYGDPVRMISVGSLGVDSLYLKEICEFVINTKGKVIIDFYTHTFREEAKAYLENLNSPWIKLKGTVDYHILPEILQGYDIGLILYKGLYQNVVNCAPNKLFEYLVCGLDVWLPKELLGSYQYLTNGVYPQVLKIDYTTLAENGHQLLKRPTELKFEEPQFFMEQVLPDLVNSMYHPEA